MNLFPSDKIKNIVLLGHGGSGKTTLADAVLFYGKATERIGKTADSTTVMDFDAEEKARKISVSTSVYPCVFKDTKVNIIDTPGLFDFAGGVTEGISAADSAVIVLSGKSGLTVGAMQTYEKARAAKLPTAFFAGKFDSTHAHFPKVLSSLTANYGSVICPVTAPFVQNDKVECFVNLITKQAFTYNGIEKVPYASFPESEEIENMRTVLLEAAASADEELMEKYFENGDLSADEILSGLKKGVRSGEICPVFAGIQQSGEAVADFTDILLEIMPSAADSKITVTDGETEKEIGIDENGTPAIYVFKTIADPFVGKLSYFKVISGKVKGDLRLKNLRTNEEERLAKVMLIKAGKQEDIAELSAGDIGCVSKLASTVTGDTLAQNTSVLPVKKPNFPAPTLSVAVYPQKKGEEEKIATGIIRLLDEEPTMTFKTDKETKESILTGLGEQHIDVVISRLKTKFGVTVELKTPKVAYRETIRKSCKVQGKYKKQSGGHGQFGDVWIEFSPAETDGLIFEESVVGGSVPKNFFPAVEKGLRESIEKGVLASFPMVGVKANLYDGSYHPVDSSEMSFKTAASLAYKEGIPQCSPVLLEPVGTLKVYAPDDDLGNIIAEVNKRRGRIIGMTPLENKLQEITGEVPIAEMSDFTTAMRSVTGGRASFTLNFERYEQVPDFIAEKIIKENKE